jgi:hypothetical protein
VLSGPAGLLAELSRRPVPGFPDDSARTAPRALRGARTSCGPLPPPDLLRHRGRPRRAAGTPPVRSADAGRRRVLDRRRTARALFGLGHAAA